MVNDTENEINDLVQTVFQESFSSLRTYILEYDMNPLPVPFSSVLYIACYLERRTSVSNHCYLERYHEKNTNNLMINYEKDPFDSILIGCTRNTTIIPNELFSSNCLLVTL